MTDLTFAERQGAEIIALRALVTQALAAHFAEMNGFRKPTPKEMHDLTLAHMATSPIAGPEQGRIDAIRAQAEAFVDDVFMTLRRFQPGSGSGA